MPRRSAPICLLLVVASSPPAALTGEHSEVERRLHAFLAAVDQRATHEDVWAEDLISTSPSGQRFGKAEILTGQDQADPSAETIRYGAKDITARLVDRIAIVTFGLTADDADGGRTEDFNTGVFRREGKTGRAFCGQASRIPDPTD